MSLFTPAGGWLPAVAVGALALASCTPNPVVFVSALYNLALALVLATRWSAGLMAKDGPGPRRPLAWLGCVGLTLAFGPAVLSACAGIWSALRGVPLPEWGLFSFL